MSIKWYTRLYVAFRGGFGPLQNGVYMMDLYHPLADSLYGITNIVTEQLAEELVEP